MGTVCLPKEDSTWGEGTAAVEVKPSTIHHPPSTILDMLQVAGWGHTQYQGQGSSSLQRVGLKMVARDQCREAFSRQQDITARMVCAGSQRGGKDACQVNWALLYCCIVLTCTV